MGKCVCVRADELGVPQHSRHQRCAGLLPVSIPWCQPDAQENSKDTRFQPEVVVATCPALHTGRQARPPQVLQGKPTSTHAGRGMERSPHHLQLSLPCNDHFLIVSRTDDSE